MRNTQACSSPGSSQRGFTILEVLIAIAIVTAFLVPLSLLFYKSQVNQQAFNKYTVQQILKREMHRAMVQKSGKRITIELKKAYASKIQIEPKTHKGEVILSGKAFKGERVVATQFASQYEF